MSAVAELKRTLAVGVFEALDTDGARAGRVLRGILLDLRGVSAAPSVLGSLLESEPMEARDHGQSDLATAIDPIAALRDGGGLGA